VSEPSCLICGRPATAPHRPFCSPRCQQVDLLRWLDGRYRIAQDDPDAPPAVVLEPAPETDLDPKPPSLPSRRR
jgi:endogenous inhibitor of DNA gyrase (YacG/DUF329 family)